jgi:putative tryptophan/tyrosine transport system substrate-binding protein
MRGEVRHGVLGLCAARAESHRTGAVTREFVQSGGLMSYGPDLPDQYWRAAAYVDKILKGARAAELPLQVAAKYELVINLKTANTLGLEISPTLLALADEVIE